MSKGSRVGRGRGSIWQPRKGGPFHAWAYENGKWIRRSTKLRDRAAARAVADRWLREGERAEATGDVLINHERRSLAEHLDDFAKAKRDDPRDLTRGHVDRQVEAIRDMCELAGWTKLNQITLASAQELLQRLRRGDVPREPEPKPVIYPDPTDPRRPKQASRPGGGRTGAKAAKEEQKADEAPRGLAPSTLNLRRAYLKGFTRWLHQKGRCLMDPLAGLTRFRTQGFETKRRRALTVEEQHKLIRAAELGQPVAGLSGPDRAMLYRVALGTGFRKNECASLSVSSFALDAPLPHVRLQGKSAKNRKTVEQPLPRSLVPLLRSWLAGRPRSDAAWPGLGLVATSELVQRDLRAAGIAAKCEEGDVDFHALRHTFGTTIVKAGVQPAEAQRLMRHSTMDLTMLLYTHLTGSDIANSVSRAFDGAATSTAETVRPTTPAAAESGEQVAAERCRNDAVRGDAIGTVPDEPRTHGAGGGPLSVRGMKVKMRRSELSRTVTDEWDSRDSNPGLRDYESRPCDSKSLDSQSVTAAGSDALHQRCSTPPADDAVPHGRRRRVSARDRAAAGLSPDVERAFAHIAELGSLAGVTPAKADASPSGEPSAEGGAS